MKTTIPVNQDTCIAASVAPEDLRCGDYVAELNVIYEFPSFLWCSDAPTLSANHPVRSRYRAPDAGVPLRVKAICLPFVWVTAPRSESRVVDIRQTELVRLRKKYAKQAWKGLKKKERKDGC